MNRVFSKIRITSSLIMILLIYIIFITGSTYAYLAIGNNNNSINGIGSCGNVSYNGTNVIGANLNTTTNYTEGAHSTVTVSKTANSGYVEADIFIHNNSGSVPFNVGAEGYDAFKYVVLDGSTIIGGGIITKSNKDQLLATIPLTVTSRTYDVYVWVDANLSHGLYSNTSYSGYIYAKAICESTVDETSSLYRTMINNAPLDNTSSTYVSSSSGINFDAINSDTNGKGVYIRAGTENQAYPIYYYRGDIDNNNVIFANMCFKIVRTTDTGGIKMIYNGVPSNGACNNTGDDTTIGTSAFNTNSESISDVGYMYGTIYPHVYKTYNQLATAYVYGKSFNYIGDNYTLTNTITSTGTWSSDYNTLNNAHYTCFNTTGTCPSIYYLYWTNHNYAYYITLTNGKSVSDALSDMLDYNTASSTIKGDNSTSGTVDYWYYNNIDQVNDSKGNSYSIYIEDTIYCNDRSFSNYSASGWNPDGGSTSTNLNFGASGRTTNPIVTCPRDIDKFTVAPGIGNGDLDYPVGLLSADEIRMAGASSNENYNYYLYNGPRGSSGGTIWWSASPRGVNRSIVNDFFSYSSGSLGNNRVNLANGVRPVVSLKHGIKFSDGDGSSNNHYIVADR